MTFVRHVSFVVIMALCLIGQAALAKPLRHYSIQSWSSENGLPQNEVHDIIQTRDGYIWIATAEGIARFDGVHFTTFNTRNTPAMRSNNIRSIAEDRWSNLWVTSYEGSLMRLRDGVMEDFTPVLTRRGDAIKETRLLRDGSLAVAGRDAIYRFSGADLMLLFSTREGIPNGYETWYEDQNGDIWAAGRDSELIRYHHGRAARIALPVPRGIWINGLDCDPLGRIFAASAAVVFSIAPNGHCQRVAGTWIEPRTLTHDQIFGGLWRDTEGNVWVTRGPRLYRVVDGILRPSTAPGTPTDISDAYLDADGHLWLGEGVQAADGFDAVSRFDHGRFDRIAASGALLGRPGYHAKVDRDGNVWIGTHRGLNCLSDAPGQTFTPADGLSMSTTTVVLRSRDGRVWIGTDGRGLCALRGDSITRVPWPDLRQGSVTSLSQDRRGDIWVGIGDKLFIIHGDTVHAAPNPSASDGAMRGHVVLPSSDGSVWVGDLNEIRCIRDGKMRKFGKAQGMPSTFVVFFCGYLDDEGTPWFGTSMGLMCVRHGRVQIYTAADGLPSAIPTVLYNDHQGNLWIGSWGSGLGVYRHGRFHRVTAADGLYADGIFQIQSDDHGNLWMGGSRGVFRVSRRELLDFVDGVGKQITCYPYDSSDGVTIGECTAGSQPSSMRAPDGSLWFTGTNGIARIDPRPVHQNSLIVKLEQVKANGRILSSADEVVPPGKGALEVSFTALTYRGAARLRFRYRLEGLDKDWNYPVDRRTATYANLAPGDYDFVVEASDQDGAWQTPGVNARFTLQPYLYQTVWFRGLVALVLLLVAVGFYRARVNQLRQRTRELEVRVGERTLALSRANTELAQVHDEIVMQYDNLQNMQMELEAQNDELHVVRAMLEDKNEKLEDMNERLHNLATTDGLTGLKNHRTFQEHLDQAWKAMARYNKPLSLVMLDVDHFKLYNDTYGHPRGDEILKQVAAILSEYAREADLVARYGGEEFALIMPETDATGAHAVAERLRAAIAAKQWPLRAITASFGVSTSGLNTDTPAQLLTEADQALYRSKAAGRNRVTHFSEGETEPIQALPLK